MFTLNNPDLELAESRNYAHTQRMGLIDPKMTAEAFTERFQSNAQKAYAAAGSGGEWPLSIESLQKMHKTMCEGLQTVGGQLNQSEVLKYSASCEAFVDRMALAQTPRDRAMALAEHTARCEGMSLFMDHNSSVHRLALESYMDVFFGKAQRPAVPQENYQEALQKAQWGQSGNLADLIQSNQRQAEEAKATLSMEKTQQLKSDYTRDWNSQNPSPGY